MAQDPRVEKVQEHLRCAAEHLDRGEWEESLYAAQDAIEAIPADGSLGFARHDELLQEGWLARVRALDRLNTRPHEQKLRDQMQSGAPLTPDVIRAYQLRTLAVCVVVALGSIAWAVGFSSAVEAPRADRWTVVGVTGIVVAVLSLIALLALRSVSRLGIAATNGPADSPMR
ncbi:hypothetical protein ACGF0K_00925 [Streptomyces sp. NPDC048156]|uniref:hypothetical protein n=1 Tax=Streptomyces sp. NPDC048156 TaxID=3365502 RepID=UPI003724AD90